MTAPAFEQYPVVTDIREAPANEAPPRGVPIERPAWLTMWDVFAALQDAADESGATPDEAEALVLAAYYEVQRCVVPSPRS